MSLRLRNYIALGLILLVAVCWATGQRILDAYDEAYLEPTTVAQIETTFVPTTASTVYSEDNSTEVTVMNPTTETVLSEAPGNITMEPLPQNRWLGFSLSLIAVFISIVAIIFLMQRIPLLGPDVICFILSLSYFLRGSSGPYQFVPGALRAFVLLLSIREIFGWVFAKCSLNWCFIPRAVKKCATPQVSLLLIVGSIVLSSLSTVRFILLYSQQQLPLHYIFGFFFATILGGLCLWKYGRDLHHLKNQLDNYEFGRPIAVGNGTFAEAEAQLLALQAHHEEAVRAAVAGERFKVELISNVSHDLRTPLTSILGYSELLQKETLSQEGQEQLRRLHQKASYMNELVESLFELTKVSSGVLESKKEQIDLLRLLEQTIGLFDDELNHTGMVVKRNYRSDTLLLITDGARMHQVFSNLLGNAIKYALPGTRIYLEIKEQDSTYLIRMTNTASYEMDFDPSEIMERFARGDKARSTKGSGLGLAIAQTYTESVGGTFHVEVDGDQFSAIV
ncbi:MAG: GHKL domain-containing protein, partial [Oscillospiraceae bacterium]|nr:GHKL domain-containing protein [Oscillospiraceae bacterium]